MKTVVSVSKGTKAAMKVKHPTEIYEFIKERRMGRRQKVGVFVGLKDRAGYIVVGWSRANIKKDRFNKETGLKIARGRAIATIPFAFPSSLVKRGAKFCERCNRFFKGEVSDYTKNNLFKGVIVG